MCCFSIGETQSREYTSSLQIINVIGTDTFREQEWCGVELSTCGMGILEDESCGR